MRSSRTKASRCSVQWGTEESQYFSGYGRPAWNRIWDAILGSSKSQCPALSRSRAQPKAPWPTTDPKGNCQVRPRGISLHDFHSRMARINAPPVDEPVAV